MSGPAGSTAGAGLQRLLLVLPLAARGDGVRVEEVAGELGVEARRVLQDLKEVESRTYYLPAGLGDQIQLTLSRNHLSVWTTGEFRRPVRLTPREALALELALRVGARSEDDSDAGPAAPSTWTAPSFGELRRRLVDAVRSPSDATEDPDVALGSAEAGDDPLHAQLRRAIHRKKELRVVYRSPGREPGPRRVAPLRLVHAEGHWYLLGRDRDQDSPRAYRLDRMIEVQETGAEFTPSDEDEEEVERFIRDGRIHDGGAGGAEPFEAVVDYAPAIARWIREHEWERTEELEDGGLRVRHQVLDPEWLLRHVLSYGPDARLVDPPWMRKRLLDVVRPMATGGRPD